MSLLTLRRWHTSYLPSGREFYGHVVRLLVWILKIDGLPPVGMLEDSLLGGGKDRSRNHRPPAGVRGPTRNLQVKFRNQRGFRIGPVRFVSQLRLGAAADLRCRPFLQKLLALHLVRGSLFQPLEHGL